MAYVVRPGTEKLWRYVDAYLPRIFGLYLHTALIAHYGLGQYATPAWLLGVFGVLLAAIPDPHSFLLIRHYGAAARRLLALTTPWLLFKAALAAVVAWSSLQFAASTLLGGRVSEQATLWAVLWFGSVEFLWSVLGTSSLACGNVRQVALTGLAARLIALLSLTAGWFVSQLSFAQSIALAAAPTTTALLFLLPATTRYGRSAKFMVFSLRKYAIWAQGIGLVTVVLFQLPTIVLGVAPLSAPAGVGQLSYISRIVLAVLQPLQIMQAMVIKETVSARTVDLLWMRRTFRVGSVALLAAGLAVIGALYQGAQVEASILVVSLAFVSGVSFSAWHRFELSQLLASASVRDLFLRGYLPVLVGTVVLISALVPLIGAVGLAVAILFGWVALSICWKWV